MKRTAEEDQYIFNLLSELECAFYYRREQPNGIDPAHLDELHGLADYMLRKWHTLTGCVNQ